MCLYECAPPSFTAAVFVEGSNGVVAYIEELPGAHAQGRTIEEARDNLEQPLFLVLLENRRKNSRSYAGAPVLKREAYAAPQPRAAEARHPIGDGRADHVYRIKSANARVWPRPTERMRRIVPENSRRTARFGIGHALAVMCLEFSSIGRLDEFDIEWYEGELVSRLCERLCQIPDLHAERCRDYLYSLANTYQVESLDLAVVLEIGKKRYCRVLFAILKELYEEEGIAGDIAAFVLQRYGFGASNWEGT
jgi:predicted RNase H-like HicB family nuclease